MNELSKSVKPSLTSIYNQLTDIRSRMGILSSRLTNAHEMQPCESDLKAVANESPDYSLSAINDKVSSIDYYLKQCEETLTKIVG